MKLDENDATRRAGLARLEAFTPRMGEAYAANRNIDKGREAPANVSELSPFLRHRLISEKEAAAAAIGAHGVDGSFKFLQEVCWRTYFKGWLEYRPGVWKLYGEARDRDFSAMESDPSLRSRYEEAIAGQAGIDGFDDWALELVETGYLHNHARMSFASIWMFTLDLPWTLGADFFLQHLLDGDPASNTLSWRWVAGLHTQGKTYLASPKAIEVCSDGRFSPSGLAENAPPVKGFANPDPAPLPPADALPDEAFGLLITEDDLWPEGFIPADAPVASVAGFCAPDARSPRRASEQASRFTRAALENALVRAEAAYGVPARNFSDADNPAAALADWAHDLRTKTIVLPWQPTGWSRDRLAPLLGGLRGQGFKLLEVRRRWDEVFWPHTRKGYFKLRQSIPTLLAQTGLTE